jgi:hypothetical protein
MTKFEEGMIVYQIIVENSKEDETLKYLYAYINGMVG